MTTFDVNSLTKEDLLRALDAKRTVEDEAEFSARPAMAFPPPSPSQGADKYAPTSWGSSEYDFTTPSGQTCRMRKVQVEELVRQGILDKLTRLPGLVEDGPIREGEGRPPAKAQAMPTKDELEVLLEVLEKLIPMVVVAPKVWPMPEPDHKDPEKREKVAGRVYPDSIGLEDRIAIMEQAVGGVRKLDGFRNGSS